MEPEVLVGNAGDDGAARRGWFVGHFVDGGAGLRATAAFEVKWSFHPAGSERAAWSLNREATSLCVLIRGRYRLRFERGDAVLAREGDYALWPPGVPHHALAEADSVVLTIRWPSKPGDSVDLPAPPNAGAGAGG